MPAKQHGVRGLFLMDEIAVLDGFEYRLRNDAGVSNPYLLTYAQAPVVLDNGANDTAETAQEVTLPCEIAGRIEKKRDRDWYRFEARKGEAYSIEVFGDRLGSPIDLYYTLQKADAKGAPQEFDDNPEILSPQFFTRTDDPQRQRFTVPADGTWLMQVSSREASVQAGPRHLYRVRITPERPDYRLIVMPGSPTTPEAAVVGRGGSQLWTVLVWRLDGFNGEVALSVEGLPPGVTCPPQVVGPGLKQATLVVSAAEDAEPWTGTIAVKGAATVRGEALVREARSATITWPVQQANILTVSRLDRSLVLGVRDHPPYHLAAGLKEVTVLVGEKVTLPVKVARLWPDFKGPLQVTALNLPAGNLITFNNGQPLTLAAGKDDASAVLDVKANAPPGTYTLVLRGQAVLTPPKDPKGRQRQNVTVVEPSAPITLTVVPKQVATVAVSPGSPTLKAGKEMELVVKVTRLNDFDGAFQVELVVPDGVKGLTAEEVTIPAGQDEAKLTVRAGAGAAPGTRAGLLVRAKAKLNAKLTATQEAKVSINVVK